jgi:4-amino-4-deoxy-L-arabinose transferase-like glycosyltransferase
VRRLLVFWRVESLFLLAVGLFALLLRLGYNAFYVGPGYVPTYDAADYNSIATSLAAGQGFRLQDGPLTALRPPLYPLMLAGIYRLSGVNYQVGLAVQAVLGAGIVLASYAVAKQVHGPIVARITALIAATYPLLIYAGGSLLSEPLFVLLVLVIVLVAFRQLARPEMGNWAALGCLLGLAWLARPNGAFLIPFLLAWLIIAGSGEWRRRIGSALVALLITVAVAMPWIMRNYLQFGRFIPVYSLSGTALLGAYNEQVLNDPARIGWFDPCSVPGIRSSCGLPEIERYGVQQRLALDFIRGHLADVPRLMWWRFVVFWHLYSFTHGFPENIGFYYYAVVTLLALPGAWLIRAKWRVLGVLLAVTAAFLIGGVLIFAEFRHRIPVEPLLIVLASVALTQGFMAFQRRVLKT